MSENRERELHEQIRRLTQEIVETEDLLTHKVLREKLNLLKQAREKLLTELGEIQQSREQRRGPVEHVA